MTLAVGRGLDLLADIRDASRRAVLVEPNRSARGKLADTQSFDTPRTGRQLAPSDVPANIRSATTAANPVESQFKRNLREAALAFDVPRGADRSAKRRHRRGWKLAHQ